MNTKISLPRGHRAHFSALRLGATLLTGLLAALLWAGGPTSPIASAAPETTYGNGTWNKEFSVESLRLDASEATPSKYYLRLHMRRALPAPELVEAYSEAMRANTPLSRLLVANHLQTLADECNDRIALKVIAGEYQATGATKWSIRVYHDNNSAEAKQDFLEVSLIGAFDSKTEFEAAKLFLKPAGNADGHAALFKAFGQDRAACLILGL